MPDPVFFTKAGPFSLADLAEISGATLPDGSDKTATFDDVAPLDAAGATDVSFLDNPKYTKLFAVSKAGACLAHPDRIPDAPSGMVVLSTPTPYLAYARVAAAFYPETANEGIHPTAAIADSVILGKCVGVGANAVISENAVIGDNSEIAAGAIVGRGVQIGNNCYIGQKVSLQYCVIGDRVRLYAGVSIGEPGFGIAQSDQGFVTVPQLGRVIIGNDVEIGTNSAVDRGAGPDTVIGNGTRIDNMVHIAHNVRIGQHCIILGQTGISGSTELEDFVVLAGQSGVAGHLKIRQGTQVGAQSGVIWDTEPGSKLLGTPAIPNRKWWRQWTRLGRLAEEKARKDG